MVDNLPPSASRSPSRTWATKFISYMMSSSEHSSGNRFIVSIVASFSELIIDASLIVHFALRLHVIARSVSDVAIS